MKKFSDMSKAERHAVFMKNLWDSELMFLEHDANSEFWKHSNRDVLLEEHKKKMASAGLVSAA